ncbi:MAG: alpha/beta-type small acid-soluble spore protein [Firmicutes bacterium]|nr:alpha/beta-type small acid-soluble spore protein [Bacillota bacterium]
MSEALKWELAHELGVADIVAREGWGGVSARNCGNLVRLAVERAERALEREYASRPPSPVPRPTLR